MKIRFLKYVDKTIGMLLTRILTTPVPVSSIPAPDKILVIRPGGIGDAVHLIPFIKVLRKAYPKAEIDILAEKRNGAVFSLSDDVSNVIQYDSLPGLLHTFRNKYDLVFDTEQWHRLSAVIARLTRASMIVGYATNERGKLFTHTVNYSQDDYESYSFLGLLVPLNLASQKDFAPPFLVIPESAQIKTSNMMGKQIGTPFAVIFPGASIEERRWGAQNFAELAARLYKKGLSSVVIGGSADSVDCDLIAGRGHALRLAGKTSLIETAAVIEKAALLISGDSGILHIGVGLDRPTVSLFGPGRADKWAPRGDKHIVINKCLPCSPCTSFGCTPKCPIDAKCMTDITVEEVMEAVDKLMIYNGLRSII